MPLRMISLQERLPSAEAEELRIVSPWWWLVLPIIVSLALGVAPHLDFALYRTWIMNERSGLLEFVHVVIPLAGVAIAARILAMAQLKRRRWLYPWVGVAALGCLYIAGEEASWGQHYLGWATPDSWRLVNDQQETNLHNTSSWFDQKPRTLLEFGVVIGGIVIPLLALWRPALRRGPLGLILPPLLCLPIALLAEIARLSERLTDLFGGHIYLFERASEVQELWFYTFVLLYLIVLRRRLVAVP